jgi:ribosome-binding ATPase YchF (GTP1/OBG family)
LKVVSENNPMLDATIDTQERSANVVPCCAAIESEIVLDDADKQDFLAEMNLDKTGLNRVVLRLYDLLHYRAFFTAGEKKCAPGQFGLARPQGAGRIPLISKRIYPGQKWLRL